jgi:hypothetical protein
MASCLAREKLYEAVWAEPISTLAPKFRVSDADLKKACAEAHIPLPGRIYWAKRRAGQTPARVALPTRSPGMSEHVVLGGPHFSWLQDLLTTKSCAGPNFLLHLPTTCLSYAIGSAENSVALTCR